MRVFAVGLVGISSNAYCLTIDQAHYPALGISCEELENPMFGAFPSEIVSISNVYKAGGTYTGGGNPADTSANCKDSNETIFCNLGSFTLTIDKAGLGPNAHDQHGRALAEAPASMSAHYHRNQKWICLFFPDSGDSLRIRGFDSGSGG